MITSMTGFGRESVDGESFSTTVEIRSVNHRYLEMSIYLPQPFKIYEDKVKRLATQYIRRGKVDIYISIEGESVYERGLHVDWQLLEQYVDKLNQAGKHFSLSGELRTSDLLQLPDVFTVMEGKNGTPHIEDALFRAVTGALRQLTDMRKSEGNHLKADLEDRLDAVESSLNKLIEQAPKVVEDYHLRLRGKLTTFLGGEFELDEARLMNEVAVFTDKVNVEEELTRLKSHLNQFRTYLSAQEAVGKKLNFLQQEMNRELNTIGAKANDFDMSVEVVEMKSELESIREQIQNIE